MALQLADRVQETSTANTTVSFSLTGAVTGFKTFTSSITTGNTTYYSATDASGNWEVGIGTLTSSTLLTRTTILSSTNSGSAVTFSGTVNVFVTYPSSQGLYITNSGGQISLQAQPTDSTATGGNARGANAVDWQTARSAASQVASGANSVVVGGRLNTASNYATSVVGGSNNLSGGSDGYGFVGAGSSNQLANGYPSGYGVIVGGQSNTAQGYHNFIGGGASNSATSGSAVTTQGTSSVTSGSTAVTLSGSNASIKVGQLIVGTGIATYTYVAAISGTSLTLSQNASATGTPTLSFYTPHGVVVGGGNNQATGSYSFIGGGGDAGTSANGNVASGDWSVVTGGKKNTASSDSCFVGGGGYYSGNTVPNTASSAMSVVVGGGNNTASGFVSTVVGGYSNSSVSTGSSVNGGYYNYANGSYSAIMGGYYGVTRSVDGYHAFPACNTPITGALGVSQAALLVLATQTTDATATVLRSNSSAATTTNQVILPNNSAYYVRGSIIAGVTGGGNTAAWTFEAAIKRGASAAGTSIVSSPIINLIAQDSGASTWTVAVAADTTNGGLKVTVTGQSSTTIRWVCTVESTEMTY